MTYAKPIIESSVTVTSSKSTSIRFQKELKETKNFGDALISVFEDLVKLEIVTWVAANGDTEAKPGNCLRTTINLIDGDIENEIGAKFLSDPEYVSLREFHESQVAKGSDTIKKNLETLVGIGEKVTALLSGKSESAADEDLGFSNSPMLDYNN
jgi:hypothetical protein